MCSRIYKAIILGSLMLGLSSQADAQILKGLFKSTEKEAIEQGAKAVGKKTAKEVGGEVAEKALKEVAQKTTKELAGELTENVIKKSAKSYVAKSTYKNVGESSLKTLQKKYAGKEARTILGEAAENAAEKSAKAFVRKGEKELLSEIGERALKTGVGNVTGSQVKIAEKKIVIDKCSDMVKKQMVSEVNEKALKKVEKTAIQGVIRGTREEVEQLLGKNAGEIWAKYFKEGAEGKTKILIKQIRENPDLYKALKNNPDLLKSFYQLVDSPFSSDITMLRYLNYNAGKFSRSVPSLASKWGYGDDIIIKTEKGVNNIFNGHGEFLGSISGNARSGYHINASPENRTLLNIFPINNSVYSCDGIVWKTDRQGRVFYAESTKKGMITPVGRDKNVTRQAVNCKNGYTVSGNATHTMEKFVDDEGGHLIALQNGGTNDLINLVGQSPKSNHSVGAITEHDKVWRRAEKSANKAIEEGHEVTTSIRVNYSDNSTMRPTSFNITQKIDGAIDVLHGKDGSAFTLNDFQVLNN